MIWRKRYKLLTVAVLIFTAVTLMGCSVGNKKVNPPLMALDKFWDTLGGKKENLSEKDKQKGTNEEDNDGNRDTDVSDGHGNGGNDTTGTDPQDQPGAGQVAKSHLNGDSEDKRISEAEMGGVKDPVR